MSTTTEASSAATNGVLSGASSLSSSSPSTPAMISPRSSSGPNNAPAIPEQPPMPFEGSHGFFAAAGEVPATPLAPCRESTQPIASLGGPHYRLPTTIRNEDGDTVARAQSFSSFPKIRQEKRVTDPIADRFVCMSYYDRTIVAIADGCGRGGNGAVAAERAVTTFVSYLSAVHFRVSNLNHLAHWLHRALSAASDAVFPPNVRAPRRTNIVTDTSFLNNTTSSSTFNTNNNESDVPRSRTLDINYVFEDEEERSLASIDDREFTSKQAAVSVSLLGGVLLRLAPVAGSGSSSTSASSSSSSSSSSGDDDWVFICISVGDCNAYHLFKDGSGSWDVFDIGAGGRTERESLTDPGGRLGPIIEGAQPDLRNLTISVRRCKPSDLLLFTTPGIHDNMHPMYLGRSPSELGIGKDWRELSDLPKAVTAVHGALTQQLKKVVLERRVGADPSVDSAVDDLCRYTMDTTKKRREFLEELVQSGAELLEHDDYVTLPGKLDHATIMALKISLLPLSGLKKTLEEVDVSQPAASSPQGAKSKRLQGGGRGRGRGGRGGGSPRIAETSPPVAAAHVPSPLAVSAASADLTPELRTLSVPTTEFWIWKAIIPASDPPTFDIWSKFAEANSPISKAMSLATDITFTNFYLNLFDPTIELRISGSRNLVEVSLRTDKDEDCEYWEKVGQIPLNRTMRKADILTHLRKLLSDGVMDTRRARAVLSKLDSFRPDIDTIAVAGTKRRLRCSALGSTFRIITGDLVIGQADVEMIGAKGETIGKFRVVDLQGSKPDYISKLVRQLIEPSITEDWELMNISELLSKKQQPPV